MHPALWISKTGLDAQQKGISTIANNLANVSTVGFKRDRAVFEDLLYQTVRQPGAQSTQDTQLPSGLMQGTGVRVVASQKIHTQGGVQQTDNSLDLMTQGRGFFQILMPDGSMGFTRAGEFQVNAEGTVVNASGHPVEPAITIPGNAQSITVGEDGVVSVLQPGNPVPVQVGSVQLSGFVNPAGLQPIGNSLFIETAASGAPQTGVPGTNGLGTTRQGMLETSNVNSVEEMVSMIEVQRAYEMNSKVISAVDSMLSFVNQTL
ncbi:flagellar basal-body rod protein FlgG [Pelagibaculum spongiae]|uniref:Flagellar basal-body rod protein FlgG n=1 Tax=Pelagibaculum spongiae TaxID=2080658 RepID=A0A2V1GR86_9GAMM|nr:flagellar basal-body rod protein FlgG [Pelagibaculum spongiae]PVZ66742.1 flagellar basal-body rod protein FlgG [Pelagibaculum spongiae]